MKDKLTAAERVAIEAWAAWYLQALTRHLKDVAAAKGRGAVDVPNPLTFAALLRVLEDLGVEPAEFFRGLVPRWRRISTARGLMADARRAWVEAGTMFERRADRLRAAMKRTASFSTEPALASAR